MRLADLLIRHRQALEEKYGDQLLPSQRRAIQAMIDCRTGACGETSMLCTECDEIHSHDHSCGHRSCPQCQNHTATEWLDRQCRKLLPVRYYMITFTLPEQLRETAYRHQKQVYDALLDASVETIKEVASNPRHLGAEPGMTAVLHTHTRRLAIHPHVHIIMPGGGLMDGGNLWKKHARKYMFPANVLKKLYREKILARLRDADIAYPGELHKMDWVVHITAAGSGEPAMKYLSRYLYRGVISERNILRDDDGQITYQYQDSKTKRMEQVTLPAADFLMQVLRHVLPKRFRRVRDYGFHHGNAKKKLARIQAKIADGPIVLLKTEKPKLKCRTCGTCLTIVPRDFGAALQTPRNRGDPR